MKGAPTHKITLPFARSNSVKQGYGGVKQPSAQRDFNDLSRALGLHCQVNYPSVVIATAPTVLGVRNPRTYEIIKALKQGSLSETTLNLIEQIIEQELNPPVDTPSVIPATEILRIEDLEQLGKSLNPDERLYAARKYQTLGQNDKALLILKKESTHPSAGIKVQVALIYIDLGEKKPASEILGKLVNISNPFTKAEMAKAYIKLGDFKKALLLIEQLSTSDDFQSRKAAAIALEAFPRITDEFFRTQLIRVAQEITRDRLQYVKNSELRECEHANNAYINTIVVRALRKILTYEKAAS